MNKKSEIMMDEKKKEMQIRKEHSDIITTAEHTSKEIIDGLRILKDIKQKIISVFGSHVTGPDKEDYKNCKNTTFELGKRDYAIVSGGGPGIMEAANSGAMKAKTMSIGFKAALIQKEQHVSDSLFTHQYSFNFLFVRRYCLAIKSHALLFYPGGYGTFNELFEYVTLIKTQMTKSVPIILVNKKYWKGLFTWIKKETLPKKLVGENYLDGIYFVDTTEEILKIIEAKKQE